MLPFQFPLFSSCVAKSSRRKQTPPWVASPQPDGLFHLELPPGVENRLARLNSSDGSSISSLALGGGGCNSEDTGYSSDQDGRLSPVDKLSSGTKHGKRSKSKSRLKNEEKEKFSDGGKGNTGSLAQTLPARCSDRNSSSSLSSSTSTCTIQEAEMHFDQLSLSSGSIVSSHRKLSNSTNYFSAGSSFRSSQDDDNDDGICLNKSDLRSSKTSSNSAFSFQSSSSRFSSDSSSGAYQKSSSRSSKSYLSNSHRTRGSQSSRSSFAQRFKNPLEWRTFHVDITLPSPGCASTFEVNGGRDRSELCEKLLGIVPTWPEDVDSSNRGHKDVEVMVKSVVAGSPVSRSGQDLQGRLPSYVTKLLWKHRSIYRGCCFFASRFFFLFRVHIG